MFTSYQYLQSHATLALGLATSGYVPEVMLQVPNAAAQLMAGSLLGRSILCFKGSVGDSPRGPLKQQGNPHLNPGIKTR
jgi:hypothetical protein